jgi:hypothetical protein
MKPVRLLAWLVSLVALIVPPLATGHAMSPPQVVVSVDCPGHALPPAPCPDHDTAKHAAGDCCAMMAPMMALLSEAPAVDAKVMLGMPSPEPVAGFAGRSITKDPPPPRL